MRGPTHMIKNHFEPITCRKILNKVLPVCDFTAWTEYCDINRCYSSAFANIWKNTCTPGWFSKTTNQDISLLQFFTSQLFKRGIINILLGGFIYENAFTNIACLN